MLGSDKPRRAPRPLPRPTRRCSEAMSSCEGRSWCLREGGKGPHGPGWVPTLVPKGRGQRAPGPGWVPTLECKAELWCQGAAAGGGEEREPAGQAGRRPPRGPGLGPGRAKLRFALVPALRERCPFLSSQSPQPNTHVYPRHTQLLSAHSRPV